jgi:hypothetical protein
MWLFVLLALLIIAALFLWRVAKEKNLDIIVRGRVSRRRDVAAGMRHVFFCFVDHYEPFWNGADRELAVERVKRWESHYPAQADRFRDDSGRPPQHTFFYPQEEYDRECLDRIAGLCQRGYGDVDIHLHHNDDTSDGLRHKIESFKTTLHKEHGLLHANGDDIEYGFIHGNWALDNSRPDGAWCGVNDEITILKETGCYADFTFPSAPNDTQPPIINQIYYATDDPARPCSHHHGVEAEFGSRAKGDLLMITGPLAINWRSGRLIPSVENGDIAGHNPPTAQRVDLWVDTGISVRGFPNWVFIKIHTHGTQEDNAKMLLGSRCDILYEHLLERYNDGHDYRLHFVTAREMYYCVKALEDGAPEGIKQVESFDYERTGNGKGV